MKFAPELIDSVDVQDRQTTIMFKVKPAEFNALPPDEADAFLCGAAKHFGTTRARLDQYSQSDLCVILW